MRLILITILTTFTFFSVQGQEVITSASATSRNTDLNISWTVGEVFTDTYSSSDITLTQGQQQSNLKIINGVERKVTAYSISLFPNPTQDFIIITIGGSGDKSLTVDLYNTQGIAVIKKQTIKNNTSLSMKDFLPGTYLLSIEEKNEIVKTYKVIKQ